MSDSEILRDLWAAHYGDGTEAKPGMMVRMDRAERQIAFARAIGMTALVAAVGIVINAVMRGVGFKP